MKLWLYITALLISELSYAVDESDYFPAHIEVKLQHSSDSFYRVVMDDNESPHLRVEHIGLYLLEMLGSCDAQQCEFFLPQDIKKELPSFIFDFERSVCFQEDQEKIPFKSIVYESKKYVDWRFIDACLPVSIHWILDDYRLNIKKDFKTLSELEIEIQQLRQSSRDSALIIESRKKQPVYTPADALGLSTRLSAITSVKEDITFGIQSDFLISSENSLSQLSLDSRLDQPIDYYNIAFNTNNGQGTFQIGDVIVDGKVFLDSTSIENGLYFTDRKQKPGFGTLNLQNSTKPNIDVDVLVNGIYRNSYRSDSFGRFLIEEDDISPGDTVTFRYFLGEGTWSEETIVISGIDNAFLPKAEWSTQAAYSNDDKLGYVSLDYGLSENASIGTTAYTSDERFFVGYQAQYLPTHWLSAQIGWLPELNRVPVNLYATLTPQQSVRLSLNKHRYLNEDELKHHELSYRLSHRNFSLNLSSKRYASRLEVISTLGLRITPTYYFTYKPTYQYLNSLKQSSTEHSLKLTKSSFSDTNWNIGTVLTENGQHLYSTARFTHDCSTCWLNSFDWFNNLSSSLNLQYRDSDLHTSISMLFDINRHLELSLSASDDEYSADIKVLLAGQTATSKESTQSVYWEEYGFATVKGRITDQSGAPISHVRLQLLNQHTETDTQGEFIFNRVPPRKELALKIDEGSLDLSLVPEYNPVILNTREVTKTQVDIELISSFGADGYIDANISEKAVIYFKHLKKEEEYASVIEDDGFYVIEGLVDGYYKITLEIGNKEYVLSKKLEGDFWISGLNFNLDDFEASRELP